MSDANAIELTRAQVMTALKSERMTFAEMIPILAGMGLLTCKETHHMRSSWGNLICESCENILNVTWSRHMRRLGARELDADEVRGAWIYAHGFIENVCMQRYLQDAVIETTRTDFVHGQDASGKPTVTEVVTKTVRRETRINFAALKLLSEVRDKMARMAGFDVSDPDPAGPTPRKKMNVIERDHPERRTDRVN
jgi:hypothetical protein